MSNYADVSSFPGNVFATITPLIGILSDWVYGEGVSLVTRAKLLETDVVREHLHSSGGIRTVKHLVDVGSSPMEPTIRNVTLAFYVPLYFHDNCLRPILQNICINEVRFFTEFLWGRDVLGKMHMNLEWTPSELVRIIFALGRKCCHTKAEDIFDTFAIMTKSVRAMRTELDLDFMKRLE